MSPEYIVVTAFLSEGCDPCISQRSTIDDFAVTYFEYPIFVSYDEKLMDDFEIKYTPSVVVSNILTGETLIFDGEASYTDLEDMVNEFRHADTD